MVKVPAVLILTPFNWMAETPFRISPWIVPDAVILVAPVIAPALVIPPELLLMPPVIEAPPAETVKPPAEIVWAAVKVLA